MSPTRLGVISSADAFAKTLANDRRFVQVQFSGRPHEPMGRRKYWPIYEACVEQGLAVMSHAFGSYGQPITGTGWPSFYVDDHVGPAQAIQANVISMRLGPRAGRAHVATRIRLAGTQHLMAIAEMSDGTCWSDTQEVIVTLAACLEDLVP